MLAPSSEDRHHAPPEPAGCPSAAVGSAEPPLGGHSCLSAFQEGLEPVLSVGKLRPLDPLLANVTPGSPQSCFLGPDPRFVLFTVALNLFSLTSSACHSIDSAFF